VQPEEPLEVVREVVGLVGDRWSLCQLTNLRKHLTKSTAIPSLGLVQRESPRDVSSVRGRDTEEGASMFSKPTLALAEEPPDDDEPIDRLERIERIERNLRERAERLLDDKRELEAPARRAQLRVVQSDS
jgi:hypothetical protein